MTHREDHEAGSSPADQPCPFLPSGAVGTLSCRCLLLASTLTAQMTSPLVGPSLLVQIACYGSSLVPATALPGISKKTYRNLIQWTGGQREAMLLGTGTFPGSGAGLSEDETKWQTTGRASIRTEGGRGQCRRRKWAFP